MTRISPDEMLEEAIRNSDILGIDYAAAKGADFNFSHEVFEPNGKHYLVTNYPLYLAISEQVRDLTFVLRHLIKKGAKPSNYKTSQLAKTGSILIQALQLSGKKRNEVVRLLLENGANLEEGKGTVFQYVDWSLGSKKENEELREVFRTYRDKSKSSPYHYPSVNPTEL